MLDFIVRIFLEFSHETIIIPMIVIGFIWFNRNIFYHATCLVLLSMLLSFALKVSFQKTSPYGFSFPSGHMQASVILYGWLAYNFKSYFLRSVIIFLLVGIGWSLIYSGFHDHYDVLGAVLFAIIILSVYYFTMQKIQRSILYLSIGLASFLMLYIYLVFNQILPHLWLAYYALIGFMISFRMFDQNTQSNKVIVTMLCFLIIVTIKIAFRLQILSSLPIYLSQLQWLLIGFSIPFSNTIANIFKRTQNAS
ncbi:MAG: phosphatase PAP2 family protein [Rickettsiales bacterium]|jgi:undecaprenyl-diphosphatase|nr:phosphatase PAP2 family protein [Rickettsiales bacterium]